MKKLCTALFLVTLFTFLLVFPTLALEASRQGLLLWFDTLVPTLLPFLVLSQLLLKSGLTDGLERLLGPVFQRLFHCSPSGAFCALCGLLCGYPVGARLITLKLKEGDLSLQEGQHLLSFCNQVSPMFCISYGIHQGIGSDKAFPYLLLIYGSALLWGILSRPKENSFPKENTKKQTSPTENLFRLIDVCIIDSFLILIKLCGYLVLFSLLHRLLTLLLPQKLCLILSAVLEITNGITVTAALPLGIKRTLLIVFALSFGGICCLFQTNSVIAQSGLSFKTYCRDKLLSALFTLFLSACFLLLRFTINGRC